MDIPRIPWNEKEMEIWATFKTELEDVDRIVQSLNALKQSGVTLSQQSMMVLLEPNKEKQFETLVNTRKVNNIL